MPLDLNNLEFVCFLSELIGPEIFFDSKVPSLRVAKLAALFRKSKFMVSWQDILSELHHINIMFLSHFTEALICSCFIVLHVDIPSIGKFNELSSLNDLNLLKFFTLSILHLSDLPPKLNFGQLFKLNQSLFGLNISLLLSQFVMIICKHW